MFYTLGERLRLGLGVRPTQETYVLNSSPRVTATYNN